MDTYFQRAGDASSAKLEIQVGVDEAGRGCMMGPVCAAAVIWDPSVPHEGINDSKKLSRKRRAALRTYIEERAIAFGVGFADVEEIDHVNILQATYRAMHRALDRILEKGSSFDRVLVDGDRFPPYRFVVHNCIPGGDAKHVCIAAASILAKEYHDEWVMTKVPAEVRERYDLANNRGYGTKTHMAALATHGLSASHRRTFCKKFLSSFQDEEADEEEDDTKKTLNWVS